MKHTYNNRNQINQYTYWYAHTSPPCSVGWPVEVSLEEVNTVLPVVVVDDVGPSHYGHAW